MAVEDNTAPTISDIQDQNVDAGSSNTYTVSGTIFDPVTVEDNCGIESLLNNFNNFYTLDGSIFPVGETIIVWTAIDFSGNTNTISFNLTVNSTTGIESLEEAGIFIFPNPTNGQINLEFKNNKIRYLVISDLSGKSLLMKTSVNKNETLDLSSFVRGVYIIISIREDDKTFTSKIILN